MGAAVMTLNNLEGRASRMMLARVEAYWKQLPEGSTQRGALAVGKVIDEIIADVLPTATRDLLKLAIETPALADNAVPFYSIPIGEGELQAVDAAALLRLSVEWHLRELLHSKAEGLGLPAYRPRFFQAPNLGARIDETARTPVKGSKATRTPGKRRSAQ